MKAWKTLRLRFAIWTAGLLFATLLLFGLFVYFMMAYNLRAVIDETLQAITTQLIVEVDRRGLLPVEDIAEEPQYERLRTQGFSMRVQNLAGMSVQVHGSYAPLLQPMTNIADSDSAQGFTTITDPKTKAEIRVYAAPIVAHGKLLGVVQVARNLNDVNRTLQLLFITLLISGPLLILAAGASGYFLAARALRPIDEITQTARNISAQDLSARLNLPPTEDEVGRLAATFDSMLARLDHAFQRERQFTADASHELRTPLAAMQTIIDSTLTRQRTVAEYEQALTDLNHEAGQMRRLTAGLLHLARSDAKQQFTKAEEVDLSLLLQDVTDSLRPLAAQKGLTLITTIAADLLLLGDSDSLIRLFLNLLDNAIKYTSQGYITIVAKALPRNRVEVRISDTGAGIAPAHLPYIFDRFYRIDEARTTEGIGLGLAIAQEIAQAHGGAIICESNVGQGTTFTVQLAIT
ncbi:MAG: sensor histidine kinase [Caldilineaceae bacterium]